MKLEKKISVEKLPRHKNGNIDWGKSIGYDISFEYGNIVDTFKVVGHKAQNNMSFVNILYYNKEYLYETSVLLKCSLKRIIDGSKKNFIYNVGDVIKQKYSDIIITKQIHTAEYSVAYEYKCLKCKTINLKRQYELVSGKGCPHCAGHKVLIGYNDLWTKYPEMCKNLSDPKIGYEHSGLVDRQVLWICPFCYTRFKQSIITAESGLSCIACGDGRSFPAKYVFNLLSQLGVSFDIEVSFDWCKFKYKDKDKKGIYDYVFELNNENYILEVDGGLHKKVMNQNSMTLEEIIFIDAEKDKLSIENGYKIIRIDCSEYTKTSMKNVILDSELNCLFDFSIVDWDACDRIANKSLVYEVCKDFNNGFTPKKLIENYKLSRNTIISYLKRGNNLGLCMYEKYKKYDNTKNRNVVCLNTNTIYNSVRSAAKDNNISHGEILACCRGDSVFAGYHFITNEKLVWVYYDDYKELSDIMIKEKVESAQLFNHLHMLKKAIPVLCQNSNKIFESISKAMKFCNLINNEKFKKCLDGKIDSYGVYTETGEPLRWAYYNSESQTT